MNEFVRTCRVDCFEMEHRAILLARVASAKEFAVFAPCTVMPVRSQLPFFDDVQRAVLAALPRHMLGLEGTQRVDRARPLLADGIGWPVSLQILRGKIFGPGSMTIGTLGLGW